MPIFQPFESEWITFGIFFILISAFVAFSEFLRSRWRLSGETTRQFVHVGVGLLVVCSPFLFISAVPPATLAIIFIILNSLAIRKGQLRGMHTTARFSLGTVFFPVTYLVLILLYWRTNPAILIIAMLIMTIADPLGSVIGRRSPAAAMFVLWRDPKSPAGTAAVSGAAFIITIGGLFSLPGFSVIVHLSSLQLLLIGMTVAIVAALSEAISFAGSDNLTLPLASALILDVMLHLPLCGQLTVLSWIAFSFLLALAAYRLKVLNLGGAAGAMLLGSLVFSIGGLFWVVPMATFFVLSSLLSKIGKNRRNILKGRLEKGSRRDILQVYANGGVSLIMAVLYYYTTRDIFYLMFLGSLASATADTWGTEIGIFARNEPRHILTFSRVPAGTSGGVTILGTFGFFCGAGFLTLSGIYPIGESLLSLFLIITVSGILGALIDSVLGATLQAQYRCPHCQKTTEKLTHCGKYKTVLISGYRWINNDTVNFICTSSGALSVLLLHALFI